MEVAALLINHQRVPARSRSGSSSSSTMCSDLGSTSTASSSSRSSAAASQHFSAATPAASELASWCCDPGVTSGLPNLASASTSALPASSVSTNDCAACHDQPQRCPDEGCCRVLRAASCCSEPSCSPCGEDSCTPCEDEACAAVPVEAIVDVACPGEVCLDVACGDKPCLEPACGVAPAGGEARGADGCLSVCDGFVALQLPPGEEAQKVADSRKRVNSLEGARLTEHDGLYGGFNSFQELLDCCCCSELYPAAAAAAAPRPTVSVPCGAGCNDVSTCGSTPGASTSASATTLSRAPSPRPVSGLAATSGMMGPSAMGRGRSMTTTSSTSTGITEAASAITAFSASGSSHTVDVDWSAGDNGKGKEPAHAHDGGHQTYFSGLTGAASVDARHATHQHHSPNRLVHANQFQQPHPPALHHRSSWTQQLQRGGPALALQHAHACASAPLAHPPHAHDEQGFCLPPAMTLCDSSGCGGGGESEAAHSHLHSYMHEHNLPHVHPGATGPAAAVMHSRSLALGQAALPQHYWSAGGGISTPTSYAPPWPSPAGSPPAASTWHSPAPGPSVALPEHICQWAGCHAVCNSIADLVSHVHEAHLSGGAGGSNVASSASAAPAPFDAAQMQQKCLWDSCDATACGAGDAQDEGGVLAHLLSAHLGASQQEQDVVALLASLHDGSATTGTGRARATELEAPPAGKRRRLTRAAQAIVTGATHAPEHASPLAAPTASHHASRAPTPTAASDSAHTCGWQGCGASFETHAALTEHLGAVHVGNGKAAYECGWVGCERAKSGQTFSQRQKVMRHLQTHTGDRPHQCTECGKRFSEPNTLAQHMRTHTLERPYKCDYPGCDKAFSVAGSLTIHKRIHSGEKPFVCSHCGKRFAESSNLTKHLRVHSGERPFACDICGRAFSRPDQVSRHRKIHTKAGAAGAASASAAPTASGVEA